jgi:hypothetical protein
MLRFILCFNANYNRKTLGKVSYLHFKAKLHDYIYIHWFKFNLR